MIWGIIEKQNSSHTIIACNVHETEGMHQTWITTLKGNSIKVMESTEFEDAKDTKDMIDFAIKSEKKVVVL